MKKKNYEVLKNVEKLKRGGYTGFITLDIYLEIKKLLRNDEYNVYYPYLDAEKVILYVNYIPEFHLYEINSYEKLSHAMILGSLFGLNINPDMFGDIVFFNDKFYLYLLDEINDFVIRELEFIGREKVKLIEVENDFLKNYQREYEKIKLIVPSLRIDVITSKIALENRKGAQSLIKNGSVFVNGKAIEKYDYHIKEGDIFSIRRFGKYRFEEVIGQTKKDNYIIIVEKYV